MNSSTNIVTKTVLEHSCQPSKCYFEKREKGESQGEEKGKGRKGKREGEMEGGRERGREREVGDSIHKHSSSSEDFAHCFLVCYLILGVKVFFEGRGNT